MRIIRTLLALALAFATRSRAAIISFVVGLIPNAYDRAVAGLTSITTKLDAAVAKAEARATAEQALRGASAARANAFANAEFNFREASRARQASAIGDMERAKAVRSRVAALLD